MRKILVSLVLLGIAVWCLLVVLTHMNKVAPKPSTSGR
jgi:hypothetical protein